MLLLTRSLALAGALLAAVAAAQTIDDDLLAAQMNYQRATCLAEKPGKRPIWPAKTARTPEGQLVTAQRAGCRAGRAGARRGRPSDAVTDLGWPASG